MHHSLGLKLCRVPLLGLTMPALSHCAYHSQQVECTVGYLVCWGWKGEGFVWHVNSNQRSDIHQAAWPTVTINLGREDSQPHFFVSASICPCLSHFHTSLFMLCQCRAVFSHSSIYLSPFPPTLCLPPSVYLFHALSTFMSTVFLVFH